MVPDPKPIRHIANEIKIKLEIINVYTRFKMKYPVNIHEEPNRISLWGPKLSISKPAGNPPKPVPTVTASEMVAAFDVENPTCLTN